MNNLPFIKALNKKRLVSFLIGIFIVLSFHNNIAMCRTARPVSMPFSPGERLTFILKWAQIPAGEAVLEVLPMKTFEGAQAYHFRMTAESNSFVDVFYKVRDRIDSYVSEDMSRTIHYKKKQREGEHKKNVQVNFDWEKASAQYSDNDKQKDPITIPPNTFDPLSVFYYSRTQELKENSIIKTPVTDGVKWVQGYARITKKETIKVPCGEFEAYLLEPDLQHVGGVFKKSKNASIKLWISADERRLPVKIASKVAVGSFVGELVSIE
ncbi:MAG: DUF3108 domain-containing protein [Desulfobacteraceae bacterium]|nr:DUF3108 domain-containing protein [Desulfobacteraceae bacterium]